MRTCYSKTSISYRWWFPPRQTEICWRIRTFFTTQAWVRALACALFSMSADCEAGVDVVPDSPSNVSVPWHWPIFLPFRLMWCVSLCLYTLNLTFSSDLPIFFTPLTNFYHLECCGDLLSFVIKAFFLGSFFGNFMNVYKAPPTSPPVPYSFEWFHD